MKATGLSAVYHRARGRGLRSVVSRFACRAGTLGPYRPIIPRYTRRPTVLMEVACVPLAALQCP